ncbi:MAG: preprotein translocase subunit SecG [Zoogloeaceae bacterium]|jgi:preprotein translocase subunit SecG|nr:preprotein translocase subunit SecG [Zoogloeaceae bacterium]
MQWLFSLLLTFQLLLALGIIWLVLMQHGKGADMGAAFGGGASGSLFGASGSANFLSRSTAVLATLFFLNSLGLAYVTAKAPKNSGSVMQDAVQSAPSLPLPAVDAPQTPDAPGEKVNSDGKPDPGAESKAKDIPR